MHCVFVCPSLDVVGCLRRFSVQILHEQEEVTKDWNDCRSLRKWQMAYSVGNRLVKKQTKCTGLCGSVNTARFLTVHSSDQCEVCCPLTSLHVRQSPKPFLAILEYCKESKSEAGEGLGTRLPCPKHFTIFTCMLCVMVSILLNLQTTHLSLTFPFLI